MGRVRIGTIRDGDWVGLRKALYSFSTLGIGPNTSPTFAGLTITGKTGILWANAGIITGDATLNQIGNLAANKTFNNAAYSISFNFTNPTNQPTYDGAFEIQASGAFTGDLLHVHQHTGNPGAGTHLLKLEATDADVHLIHCEHSTLSTIAIHFNVLSVEKGKILADADAYLKDISLTTPVNVYNLSHDSFANFVELEHVNHSAVNITAGTGMSGGGSLSVSRTLDCTISQYTDEMAQDTIGGILTCSDASISITYDDATPFIRLNAVGSGYTDEQAQDAVGSILTVDGTLSVTYDDATPLISIKAVLTGIDHDGLLNFASLEHVDHSIVNITAGTGLTGGGTLSVTRTLATNISTVQNALSSDYNISADTTWETLIDATLSTRIGVTLPAAGDYLIFYAMGGYVKGNTVGQLIQMRLYNQTDAAAVSGSTFRPVAQSQATGVVHEGAAACFKVLTVAASKEIVLQAYRTAGTWTNAQIPQDAAKIVAIRLA